MTKIQLRRDTATNWASANPILASGEPAFETDTGKFKIGDGVTAYNSLPYKDDGGGSGTTDYTDLTNKPQINSIELTGNKTSTDLGLASASEVEELDNKLNQLAGVVETKEDNITALSPLTLEQKTSSTGSVGFTVSEANTLTPSSDVISLDYSLSSPTTIASTFNNYIVIPYSYLEKTVVRIPCNSGALPTHNTSVFLGYLEDGVVQPLVYFPICQSTNNASTNYVYTMDTNNPNASVSTHPNNTAGSYNADGLIEGKYYSYLTTYYSPQWNQYALTSYSKNGESGGKDLICFQRYNFDSTEEKAAIEKANCIVISYGVSLNQFPIDLNICGKFPYKGDYATGAIIPYDAPLDDVADLTDNILDFTTVTTNELALNIDNSTIKVNDSGQLYANVSSAPANMVTTDTNQTITGTKNFTNSTPISFQAPGNSTTSFSIAGDNRSNLVIGDFGQNFYQISFSAGSGGVKISTTGSATVNNNKVLTTADNSTLSSLALPSSTKYTDLTLGVNNTKYTAPANGWFSFFGIGGSVDADCILGMYISNNNETINTTPRSVIQYVHGTTACSGIFPVKKGDIVAFHYYNVIFSYGSYNNLGLKFIYAEGEV